MGAFDRIVQRKIRRRILRRLEVVALAVVVVGGSVGGAFALGRAFRTAPTPAVSPKPSGTIAFVSDRDGAEQIFAMEADGSGVRQLTSGPARHLFPAWSRDGSKIAYVEVAGAEGSESIWIMDDGGRAKRRLTDGSLSPQDGLTWAPGGTRLAFVAATSHGTGIWTVEAKASFPAGARLVDHSMAGYAGLAWSPDGTSFVFKGVPAHGRRGVYIMPAGGGLPSLVADVDAYALAWSPDGTRIAFSSVEAGTWRIYVMNADGSGLRALTDAQTNGQEPTWAGDGSHIAFAGEWNARSHIYVMKADGSGQTRVTDGATNDSSPSWQPLGTVSPVPVPSRRPSPRATTPPPAPSPSPSSLPTGCDESRVVADFDGDGTPDTATVALTRCLIPPQYLAGNTQYNTRYAIHVEWPYPMPGLNPAEGVWPLQECKFVCRAEGAIDIDHNGTAELALVVDEGASTELLWLLELAASEHGPVPLTVVPPGTAHYPAGKPALLALAGSVHYQNFLSCRGARLIATGAALSDDLKTWHLQETVFKEVGNSLIVVSNREYSVPASPNEGYAPVQGPSCFPSVPH